MRGHVILVAIILLSFLGCNKEVPFNQKEWMVTDHLFYPYRKLMVKDLIKNYLVEDLCYDSIVNLLGVPAKVPENRRKYHVFYEVEVSYSGLDTEKVKYLDLTLNKDSCFIEAKMITIKY